MSELRVRALELHSGYAWDFAWARKALRFIRDNEMTTLVLHRNDIVDAVVYPSRLFGGTRNYANIFERYQDIHRALYKYTPTRRSPVYQRRDYLRRVIDLAARSGIDVWFENKELSFHEIVLELNPQLVKNGTVCPNEPYWWDFVQLKYTELFEDLPGLAGIICAPGTGESRLSITANRCTCSLCRDVTPSQWYTRLIESMRQPIRAAGAQLAIRDFVFDRASHEQLAAALEGLPDDIIISLKNTPHDYYPTFPDNPRIGHVGRHRQWIEFDTMGQYFGWGIAPAVIIDDLRRRLATADRHGAEGAIFRTDWESLDGHSAFQTPNLINLYAGAMLSRDRTTPSHAIYARWLIAEGLLHPDATDADIDAAAAWIEKLLGGSWEITRRTLFMHDCVFSDCTNYPVSLAHAWWLAEEKNSLKDWDNSKARALATTPANVDAILAEKDEACARVDALEAVFAGRPPALSDAAWNDLRVRYDVFRYYVHGFRAIGHACILARYLLDHPGDTSDFHAEAQARIRRALDALLQQAAVFEGVARTTDYQHTVYTLLSPDRLRALHADLTQQLSIDSEALP
jgi:hypothetical protein